jgi:type VI secretion system secreted protein VgrG
MEVEKNESQKVGVDRTVEVGQNHQEKIGVDRALSIGGNESKSIGLNLLQNIGANQVKNVMATATENVGMVKTIVVGAAMSLGGLKRAVGGTGPRGRFETIVHGQINIEAHTNLIELIRQNNESRVDGYKQTKVGDKYYIGVTVDGAASGEPAGSFTTKAKTIKLEATEKIELICGQSRITLLPKQATVNCAKQKIDLHEGGIIEVTGAAVDVTPDEEVNIDSKKIQLEAQNVLEMSGKTYSLDTSGGDGEIKSKKMVKVKAPQVHINC